MKMFPSLSFVIFILLKPVLFVSGQISNSTESPENVYVKLTFKIPTSVGQPGRTIIKLERGDGSPSQDVLFINNLDFSTRVQEAYTNRLTVTTLVSERIVEISILGVQSRDAGMYTCWQDSAFNFLSSLTNCGHKLTIVHKPSSSYMTLNPFIISDTKIIKKESEELTITCAIRCVPVCDVRWSVKAFNALNFSSIPLDESHTLSLRVKRTDQGTYRCTGSNKHGQAYKQFELEVHYISTAVVRVNEKPHNESVILLVEKEHARLQCIIDAHPAPKLAWNSPTRVLLLEEGKPSPQVSSRVLQNNYTSSYTLNSVQCEDIGIYSCEGYNRASSVEKKIFIFVLCPPSSADIPLLKLEPNYVWDMSKVLNFSFVIKAYPEPNVTRVVSMVDSSRRTEDMTKDVFITKMSTYDGRNYLTKFTFTVIRTLDNKDINRVFTLTFQSKYFTRELQFVVRPRGPPQPVTNVTIRDVTHSSVKLLWLSGFNGGEQQEFIVKFRHFSESPKSSWTSAVAIGDGHKSEVWTETVMTDLGSGTDYEFQIVSSNRLGSVQSETYRFRTLERTILNVGVIAGIVISVVIVIFTLLTIVIIRRKSACSSRSGETRDVHVPCHSTDQAETNDDQRYTDVAGTSRELYINAVAKGRDEKCRPTTDVYDTCTQDTDTDEEHYQSLVVINTDNRTPDQRNTSAEICKTTV